MLLMIQKQIMETEFENSDKKEQLPEGSCSFFVRKTYPKSPSLGP